MAGLDLMFADEVCAEALSDRRLLAAMARFESALARAGARAKLIPAAEAEVIARVCEKARFEPEALARAARRSGTLALPFVKQLTDEVAAVSPDAARYVHLGATSQDVIDSAIALCMRPAAARIVELTVRLGDAAAAIAKKHARTPIAGRTLLQPALPVPFGWKAAIWLSMLARSMPRFRSAADDACLLQFGGAAGTLSAFGAQAMAVEGALASELGLPAAKASWHSARDAFARVGAEAAILAGAAGKIARDVSLLMQPEIGEAAESSGGGSSSMPHKRNPSASVLALEAAQRAPGLVATLLAQLTPEHERGLGQWQSQWLTLRELLCAASSGLSAMAGALEGLQLDTGAMQANLERTHGLVFSEAVSMKLSRTLGKAAAHSLTEELCARALAEGKPLRDVVRADPRAAGAIPAGELDSLFDPASGFGGALAMTERVLVQWSEVRATSPGTKP